VPLQMKPTLTLEMARRMAKEAETYIAAHGLAMFVAIVDAAGVPLLVTRHNDAQPASFEVALHKARAAVGFRRPTRGFEDRILKDGRVNLVTLDGIVAVEGGVPCLVDGACVGAIGVSGGTGVEDGQVAQAAAAVLPSLL
jgi:glc operon protein GlcG